MSMYQHVFAYMHLRRTIRYACFSLALHIYICSNECLRANDLTYMYTVMYAPAYHYNHNTTMPKYSFSHAARCGERALATRCGYKSA